MKTQPRQHIFNKYNTCTVVTSPVYIGSKAKQIFINKIFYLDNKIFYYNKNIFICKKTQKTF